MGANEAKLFKVKNDFACCKSSTSFFEGFGSFNIDSANEIDHKHVTEVFYSGFQTFPLLKNSDGAVSI